MYKWLCTSKSNFNGDSRIMVTLLTKIIRAIHKINPNAGVTMSGNTIDELEIEWLK